MTKAHSYASGTDARGRVYYRIDGHSVSSRDYGISYGKSQRAKAQIREGRKETGMAGVFRPRETREVSPRKRTVPLSEIVTRERIRGTRQAVLVRHTIPSMSGSEAVEFLRTQYDRGGNYVLDFRSVKETEWPADEPFPSDEDYLGDDGSADES